MNKNIKIHVDTDIGGDIDDLCALTFLLQVPDIEITGITIVGDTNGKRTGYCRHVLKLAGREDIPVAAGAETSQGFYRYELGLPDEKRYWKQSVEPSANPCDEAIELLKKSIEQDATIIGIGPFTNLYLVDRKYPGILKNSKLFLMGGFVYPTRHGFPEWKNEFDFNIQIDVTSAKHVLENSNPTLIPLPVTAETFLKRSYLDKLRKSGPIAQLLAHQAEQFAIDEKMEIKYGKTCTALPKDIINFLYDPLTCAVAIGWTEGVVIERIPLVIQEKNGWLEEVIDDSGKPTSVVTKIDGQRFSEFWLDQITKQTNNKKTWL